MRENQSSGFPTRSDTDWPVQSQKKSRSLDFGFKKKINCTIRVAKTKVLISFAVTEMLICAFVFAQAKIRFSHDAAHICLLFYPVDIKQSLSEPSDDVGIEMHFVREKKLVDKYIIKSGMLRFNFLLECSHPGTVPDPQLVAAMLQLVGRMKNNKLPRSNELCMLKLSIGCTK